MDCKLLILFLTNCRRSRRGGTDEKNWTSKCSFRPRGIKNWISLLWKYVVS